MSKKYVIEIPDDVQYVLLNGKADHKYYTAVHPIAELEELNSDYINEHFGDLQDDAYQLGLDDAWEAAKKIALDPSEGCTSVEDLIAIFGSGAIQHVFRNYSATETIEKLKAYEEKQKADDDIKVGDEMRQVYESGAETGLRCIVTAIDGDRMSGFAQDGKATICLSQVNRWWKKTGRHFDIDKILEEMRS